MLDAVRRFFRAVWLGLQDKTELYDRLEDAERRLYKLEQDYIRLLATVRKGYVKPL